MQRDQILTKASLCVSQDRATIYGDAEHNFETIARLWTVYLGANGAGSGQPLTAADVGGMMTLLKLARAIKNPQHLDSYVDACGYLALAGEIARAR